MIIVPEPASDRHVAVLSFSRIERDRRVLRQCALLTEMGSPPLVIGYGGRSDNIGHAFERWPVPQPTTAYRLRTAARQLPAHLGGWAAHVGFWAEPRHRWALRLLCASPVRLVIANDWPALAVAARWKALTGGVLHYDTHEFATLEFDERATWRLIYKPFVRQLERAAIKSADVVSTVGPRLAEELREFYDLPQAPLVIRNIPDRIDLPNEPETAWPLRLLYHGQVLPDRGLEALIDSRSAWTHAHSLMIRGDGDPAYIARLRERAAGVAAMGAIVFEPAVPPDEVMPLAARSADIGVHFTPLETMQRHFSLPNKLFEYIGSGLAVAVSPGTDLRRIVERYGLGVVSADPSPLAIAAAINGLTHAAVVDYRAKAREAVLELSWETERQVLRESLAPTLRKL